MQQFTIPQFIDVESKIIGAMTTRQFLICLSAGGLLYIIYKLADFTLFVFLGLIIIAVFGALGFLPINGRPMHFFLLNFMQTLKKPKTRVWNKHISKTELKKILERNYLAPVVSHIIQPKGQLPQSSLRDLALVVDTGGVYHGDNLLD